MLTRYFVIGGAGPTGRLIVDRLVNDGHPVTGAGRHARRAIDAR